MKKEFLVPIVTPFKDDFSVDYKCLARLVEYLKPNVDGFYVSGSTGECFYLTMEERKNILETVIEAAGEDVYIAAHVGHIHTGWAQELARHAQSAGAHIVASVPPPIYKYSFTEYVEYYRSIAYSTDIPLMIYNLPSLGVSFNAKEFEQLLAIRKDTEIKFTDTNYFVLERVKKATGAYIYSGCDESFLPGLAAGADGAIGTTLNLMTGVYRDVQKYFKAGNNTQALEQQSLINAAVTSILKYKGLSAVKYMLKLKGVDISEKVRTPNRSLTDVEKGDIEKDYAAIFIHNNIV